jgi:hypothetical protein
MQMIYPSDHKSGKKYPKWEMSEYGRYIAFIIQKIGIFANL